MATNLEFIKSVSSSASVTSVDITDCFSDKYDVYKLILADLDIAGAGDENIAVRFLDSGGSVISASEYDYATYFMYSYASYSDSNRATGQTSLVYGMGYSSDRNDGSLGSFINIFNPYDSSSYTFTTQQSTTVTSSSVYAISNKGIGVHKSAEQLSGVRIFVDSGTIERLGASIYGVK